MLQVRVQLQQQSVHTYVCTAVTLRRGVLLALAAAWRLLAAAVMPCKTDCRRGLGILRSCRSGGSGQGVKVTPKGYCHDVRYRYAQTVASHHYVNKPNTLDSVMTSYYRYLLPGMWLLPGDRFSAVTCWLVVFYYASMFTYCAGTIFIDFFVRLVPSPKVQKVRELTKSGIRFCKSTSSVGIGNAVPSAR